MKVDDNSKPINWVAEQLYLWSIWIAEQTKHGLDRENAA